MGRLKKLINDLWPAIAFFSLVAALLIVILFANAMR
jgi:hypothetical protein